MNPWYVPFGALLIIVVRLDVKAFRQLYVTTELSWRQKVAQSLFVAIIPIFGAMAVSHLLTEHHRLQRRVAPGNDPDLTDLTYRWSNQIRDSSYSHESGSSHGGSHDSAD